MKLYIIGNGFDLAHNIKSGYEDFEKFMSVRYGYEKSLIGTLFDHSDVDLWADFENALGLINPNNVVHAVETEARMNEPEEIGRQSNFMIDTVSQACDALQRIFESHFAEWVAQINIMNAKAFLRLDPAAYYFTFNYTETLEDIYGIPAGQVLHIHNCRRDPSSPIVGHGYTNSIPFKGEAWIATDDINDSIKYIHALTRKNVQSCITQNESFFKSLNQVNEINVFGHSLNKADLPYFQKIIEHVSPTAYWKVSYHDPVDQTKFRNILCRNLHISTKQLDMITLKDPSLHLS